MAACLFSASAVARAQAVGSEAASAEALFQDAKRLLAQRRVAEACPKLLDSYRIEPATGTLLALAICHEAEGKTASAWAEFKEVVPRARHDGRADRERAAAARIAALEPKLSRLSIVVPAEVRSIEGLVVKRDGAPLTASEWETDLPIDPGEHRIEATAPGREAWTATVSIKAGATSARIVIGELPIAAPPPSAEPSRAASASTTLVPPRSTKRTAGWVTIGVGGAAVVSGAVFGLMVLSQRAKAESLCPVGTPCRDPSAVDAASSARTSAVLADIGFGVGLAAIAIGAYLLLTAQPPKARPAATGLSW